MAPIGLPAAAFEAKVIAHDPYVEDAHFKALGVWEREPVPSDSPLLGMDKVIASPHAAYYSSSAVARVPRRCGEKLVRALRGGSAADVHATAAEDLSAATWLEFAIDPDAAKRHDWRRAPALCTGHARRSG